MGAVKTPLERAAADKALRTASKSADHPFAGMRRGDGPPSTPPRSSSLRTAAHRSATLFQLVT